MSEELTLFDQMRLKRYTNESANPVHASSNAFPLIPGTCGARTVPDQILINTPVFFT